MNIYIFTRNPFSYIPAMFNFQTVATFLKNTHDDTRNPWCTGAHRPDVFLQGNIFELEHCSVVHSRM